MSNNNNTSTLPPEFLEGPWIPEEELMAWIKTSRGCLKSRRSRGKIGYSYFDGIIMYNKAWILHRLAQGWILKQPKPRKKKPKPGDEGEKKE